MKSDPSIVAAFGRRQPANAPAGAPSAGRDTASTPAGGHIGSRRRFLRAVGAAAAALPFVPLLPAVAQVAPATGPVAPPVPAATPPVPPAAGATAEAEFAADARTLLELVERRFGSRLTAAEKDAVRADLQDGLESGRALRNLDLGNADEPDVVFRAQGLED